MSDALLPEGFRDRLPPHADAAARFEAAVLATAHAYGYERADPPLAEFEDGLATRLGGDGTRAAVRFVDPVSQRGLAIRPDLTAQIGRIAATRMADNPRPVRLSYAGPVLRLRAAPLDPARERRQAGCELIGRDSVAAAREIVEVAIAALTAAGVTGISVDFTLPDLVDTLAGKERAVGPLPVADVAAVRAALDAKDAGAVAALAPAYLPLIAAAGPFADALTKLRDFDARAGRGGALASRLDGLAAVADGLDVRLTLDPTERHGFEYQSWFGFSLFAEGIAGEIGRGGTYLIHRTDGPDEPATGFSLYPDMIAAVAAPARRRLWLPLGTAPALAGHLRGEGWVAVAALDADDSAAAQLCTHQLADGVVKEI